MVWLAPGAARAYTVILTRPELQAIVATQFPKAYETAFGQIQLHSPRVVLTPGSSRLGLRVGLRVAVAGESAVTGSALVDGEPAYDPQRREFHLREPQVRELTTGELPPPYAEMAEAAVAELVRQQFPVIVVYRIDASMLKESQPLRMLKSVKCENGVLRLELGR